jgi:hypothetical protein
MAGCVRSAWLVLGGQGLLLEDPTKGYFCTQLDLGFPAVREVISNRPGMDGSDDRTQYMGSRVVTANITTLAGAGGDIDAVAASFAPYMSPDARPVLHYVLDRPGQPERTMTLRAAGYSWPIAGPNQRDIQLQWVAADPACWDPNVQSVTAYSGASVITGRSYPLTFNRVYPAGGGTGPAFAQILSHGHLTVQPLLTIYGPITAPQVTFATALSNEQFAIPFDPGFIISSGGYVTVDTLEKTAYLNGDPTQPVMHNIDWLNASWPSLPVAPDYTTIGLKGSSTVSATQVVATWQDRYLT